MMIQILESFVHRVAATTDLAVKNLADRPIIRITMLVIIAMILVFGTEVTFSVIAPLAYARGGFLYFRFDELLGFFIVVAGILMWVSRVRPHWRLEHFFFRFILSLVTISVLWIFVNFSEREFAQYILVLLFVYLFLWSFWGTYLKPATGCVLMVVALLVVPLDIVVSSPLRSTDGRQASVELLEAQYGLIRNPRPGTYSMGCMVPPNPLAWVLWIDPWPLVDQAFQKYDDVFQVNTRTDKGS
jgi:hypothetical protein